MKLTENIEGTLIKVVAKPRSKGFKLEQEENNLVVHCRSPPEKGKANKELIKELSRFFGHEVFIISGLMSREKIILVENAKPHELNSLLLKRFSEEPYR